MINLSLKYLNLSSEESKEIVKLLAEKRGIKDSENMSEDRMLSAPKESKSLKESENNFDITKPEINFSKSRIEKIRKKINDSRHKFSKPKIKEIRRNLYELENEKNLSLPNIKEIGKILITLEENLLKTKKYYDHDEYKGISNLFDLSVDEDCYKPIITNSAFEGNYIQYESKGNKEKILTISEYLHMIRPYLRDIVNDHKTQGE